MKPETMLFPAVTGAVRIGVRDLGSVLKPVCTCERAPCYSTPHSPRLQGLAGAMILLIGSSSKLPIIRRSTFTTHIFTPLSEPLLSNGSPLRLNQKVTWAYLEGLLSRKPFLLERKKKRMGVGWRDLL